MYSVVVKLGEAGAPLDTAEWDALCKEKLGKTVPLGAKLSQTEWRALGYFMAAGSADSAGARGSYWLGISNLL